MKRLSRSSVPFVVAAIALCFLCSTSPGPATGAPPSPDGPGLTRLAPHSWAWVATDETSSNSALFVGRESALIVDPGLTPALRSEFVDAVRTVTDLPIRWTVLTHWHPDHAFGSVCVSGDLPRGATGALVAHPSTRRTLADRAARLSARVTGDEGRCDIRLPDHVVDESETFNLGDLEIEVRHTDPAHTRGDLIVWCPEDRVLVTGDQVMNASCPSMGEGSVLAWVHNLDDMLALQPAWVVPGHFGVGDEAILRRFRDYLSTQTDRASDCLSRGDDREACAATAKFPGFRDFSEYPRYGATFADNARTVYDELQHKRELHAPAPGFLIRKVLELGEAPHQIAFTPDGSTAFVAVAGSDRVARVNASDLELMENIPFEGTPLGIAVLANGEALAVTAFRNNYVGRLNLRTGTLDDRLVSGEGASLFEGPFDTDHYLVPVETENLVLEFDVGDFSLQRSFPVGARPFPPAVTSDGRLAFVPNYDDATVTVIDLFNSVVVDTIPVGAKPSDATTLPGNIEIAIVARGNNKVQFLNTASHRIVDEITDGIGDSPFSLVVSRDGRWAAVNNTSDGDLSILDLDERRVIGHVEVGEIPIVMAVNPVSGDLWVSCEGSHEVYVLATPGEAAPDPPAARNKTQVAVMGMIHDGHRTSKLWGLDRVEQTIRNFDPDVVLPEIPPDRWARVWREYAERGEINDPRVRRFPEYTDVLLDLKVQLGFAVEPCAAWNREMSDLRQARMHEFSTDLEHRDEYAVYQVENSVIENRQAENPVVDDDPRVIHSDAYDARTKEELEPYDRRLNDFLGPGGWTNINEAHYALIDRALREHAGERVLITFGAGHKYWFLEQLRQRDDIELVDLRSFLPPANPGGQP